MMKTVLPEKEDVELVKYFLIAAEIAQKSLCHRSKCGSILVKDNQIIGSGYNSPPKDECLKRCFKDDIPKDFKSDRNCCVHAEERAIIEALKSNGDKIVGSRLFFIRTDMDGEIIKADRPFCTICSKLALDVGVKEFVLWHEEGICIYDTKNYNEISFEYRD